MVTDDPEPRACFNSDVVPIASISPYVPCPCHAPHTPRLPINHNPQLGLHPFA